MNTIEQLKQEIERLKSELESQNKLIQTQSSRLNGFSEAKSRFFANVSHDLRTPLSLIFGNLEMLADDEETILSQASKRNLEIGLKNCKRLLYLTDEINDLTQLEHGNIQLKKEVISVGSYLEMIVHMFQKLAEQNELVLTFENQLITDDNVEIDPAQFEKIIYNLVSNSIRFSDKGGEIHIGISKENDNVKIEVSDTGDGIPEESLPYIFEKFYQSKSNPHRSREGLGIGLALVKELVAMHNGEINVTSTVGVGTKFILLMPITSEELSILDDQRLLSKIKERRQLYGELDKEQEAGPGLPKQDQSQKSILIVDDHPEIRYHLRQILEDDHHIIEAAHGLEALDVLKVNEVDLIISDLMMPWMDGFELLEAIKSNEEYSKIPVLVVSARISDEDQQKVLYQGVNDYLKKPFNKKELVLRINNLLQQKDKWSGEENGFESVFNKNKHEVFEKDIMVKVESLVMEKIDDPSLSVYHLADAMAASERKVYRLIKKMTGLTPYEYITEIRLKYADYLIRKNRVKNATEAARSIGLRNVTTFNKQYEKKFGKKPAEIINA